MSFEILEDDEFPSFSTTQRGSPKTPARFEILENDSDIAPEKKIEDMSWWERKFTHEGQKAEGAANRNKLKAFFSGATAGFSEIPDSLKVDYEQEEAGAAYAAGALLPIGLTYKAVSVPFKVLNGLFKFGSKGAFGLETAKQALTGFVYGSEKEIAKGVKGEETNISEPIKEAALFSGSHIILGAGKASYDWIKTLNPSQKAQALIEGILPKNLTENQYKFWEKEVAPEWIKSAENEYKSSLNAAKEEADQTFQQQLKIAKAEHEKDLYEAVQSNRISEEGFKKSQNEYQNKLKQIAAEHESKLSEIDQANQQAINEFETSRNSFEELQARQRAVEEATALQPGEENLPYRQSPSIERNPSLENRVGNIIAPNEITNTTNAGKANIEAVRANDAIDYSNVNKLYETSRELNSQVEVIQPNLVMEMIALRNRIKTIPAPDPIQKQQLNIADSILEKTAKFGSEGTVTEFIPINNNILAEQAKAIRYFMDFGFEHGNARGILSPMQRQIEDAITMGAHFVRNEAAAEANQASRAAYKKWAQDYDNPYIRPYRDVSNFDYSKTFRGSLNVDEYKMLDNILSRSNASQHLSQTTKRALVEKQLGKFLDNPQDAIGKEFEQAINELTPILSSQEKISIRNEFHAARNEPKLVSKSPRHPDLKEYPKEVKIPLAPSKTSTKEINEAKIPIKTQVKETPEMQIASKEMKMEPEEIRKLSDSPSGLKKLKERLSKEIFQKIGKQKVKDILFEGNVKRQFTGKELYKTINKGKNYELISEILGESETNDLLQAAEQIADKRATVDTIQKYTKKITTIKYALLLGIL